MFQSLFFWNHYLDPNSRIYVKLEEAFQSLFFWNHYLDSESVAQTLSGSTVSILVFLEPLLRRARGRHSWESSAEFQSLFFWNHYLDNVLWKAMKEAVTEFQSLFFWNHYLDQSFSLCLIFRRQVSILVFLEPLLRQLRHTRSPSSTRVSILVFLEPLLRPYFPPLSQLDFKVVSILVFLEPLLRPEDTVEKLTGRKLCFNPCFSGTTT